MDMWIVGAAAAAGYIAKQLKLLRDEDSLLESSSGATEYDKPGDFSCHLRRLTQKRKQPKNNAGGRQTLSESFSPRLLDSGSEAEAASVSSCSQKLENLGNYEDYIRFSVPGSSNLFADGGVPNGNVDHVCVKEMDAFHSSTRNIASLRTKRFRRHLINP